MADDRTKVTELATALGMAGHSTLQEAIKARPAALEISADEWDDLDRILREKEALTEVAKLAFANGTYFAAHEDGLNGRIPRHIEWSGGRRIPGDRPVPADLVIDRVYMVSCKYLSKILHNTAPSHVLLDGLVAAPKSRPNWFQHVAPAAHKALYSRTVDVLGLVDTAQTPEEMTAEHRREMKNAFRQRAVPGLPPELDPEYKRLIKKVSKASAKRWRKVLGGRANQERILWRLLRIYSATYFILGIDPRRTMQLRVMTPWEWRQSYKFMSLTVGAAEGGQPRIDWKATYRDLADGKKRCVGGHVEIRWSHRPFCGPPEAKVYLDTPHADVPGYRQLDYTDEPPPYDQQSLQLDYTDEPPPYDQQSLFDCL